MKKRLITFILALVMCFSAALPASAAFEPVRPDPGFADTGSHWAKEYINVCYRLGLMSGKSDKSFDPAGNLSLAEAITVAVRLADIYAGGDGVLDQSGGRWYDSAVAKAKELGLITEGQYTDYGRPALRRELAGLLAHALPESEYEAINKITKLPDVSAATEFYKEIFLLYNAGILTGSDNYGSFLPDNSITRAELAAILCRLVQPETRKQLNLAAKPADLTVWSTDSFLYVDGIAFPGIVTIDGEPCIIGDTFNDTYSCGRYTCYFDVYHRGSDKQLFLSLDKPDGEIIVPAYTERPRGGVNMGTADAERFYVTFSSPNDYINAEDCAYAIGGNAYMIPLSLLGAEKQGKDYYINTGAVEGEDFTLKREYDLLGAKFAGLQKAGQRETILALHDALVNAINYDPLTSGRYLTEAEINRLLGLSEAAAAKYSLPHNRVLEYGYGICQDYAEIFLNLCLRNAIPCTLQIGDASGPHAWNRVYADGKWSFVDCTWDDPIGAGPVLSHDYFMVDADTLAISHYWEGSDYPMPEEYDPAWEQLDPNNITSRDMFRKCVVAQFMMGKQSFSLRVTVPGAYGGAACVFRYPVPVWGFQYYYNSYTGTYDFSVTW